MARMSRTWWGQIFLDVLEECMDEGRLRRGRAYSGPNRLLRFEITGTGVQAVVRGNINPYFGVRKEPRYKVSVRLKRFTPADWNRIVDAIGENAACLSQLLMDEMPRSIDEVCVGTGKSLLPHDAGELVSTCSCPDWASPCKHVAGVYYKLASLLDRDPMLLFQLRGMNLKALQKRLSRSPLARALADHRSGGDVIMEYHSHRFTQPTSRTAGKISLKSFWKGSAPLPRVDAVSGSPPTPAVLVKRGGDYPGFWHIDRSFIETMEEVSIRIVDRNKASL